MTHKATHNGLSWLIVLAGVILASLGAQAQTITPYPAGYCNATNGAGGWTMQLCGSGGGSTTTVYASSIAGAGTATVAPGSSAVGTTDKAAAFNTALATGNKQIIVDGQYALSTSLVMYSGDAIVCTPGNGFIMQTGSNATPIVNAHPNAPTATTTTGGYTVSNQTDKNLLVRGCIINANSTEAVTGTQGGVQHKYNPATGLWVVGVQFIGVIGVVFDSNELYDAATYGFMGSNDTANWVRNNYIHFPTPIVHSKNTACVQYVGPATLLWIDTNRLQCGDDSIALNADDGNRPGSGDSNSPYGSWPGTKWGTINHAHADNNIFDASFFGFRILSAAEIADDITVTNTTGNLCGNTFTMQSAYPSIGAGNVGTVTVNGWNVPTDGTCNDFAQPFNFDITENYKNVTLANIQLTPGINWPILTHNVMTPGTLSLRGWDILSPSLTGFSLVSFTGGALPNIQANSLQWTDNASNAGSVFLGTATPGSINVSNYAGPNRLLGAGFAPVISNGDAFTNTYASVAVTYVNTTFNEAASGTAVAGTTPATCANGCTGAWAASSGGPTGTGVLTYGTNNATITGVCTAGGPDIYCPVTVNPGHTNFTMRVNITANNTGNSGWGFVTRWTNNANFVTWVSQGSNLFALCDVVANVTTCGSNQALTESFGTYTVVMNGTTSTLTNPGGTMISGTISGSNTTGGAGINSNQGSSPNPITMSALSIKSF